MPTSDTDVRWMNGAVTGLASDLDLKSGLASNNEILHPLFHCQTPKEWSREQYLCSLLDNTNFVSICIPPVPEGLSDGAMISSVN